MCHVFFTTVNSPGFILCVTVGEVSFRSDITRSVVSVGLAEPHIHMFHSFGQGLCFFYFILGASSVTAVNIDCDLERSSFKTFFQ